MCLFDYSHTHFGMDSTYFSYLLSKATVVPEGDDTWIASSEAIIGASPSEPHIVVRSIAVSWCLLSARTLSVHALSA